MISPIDPGEMRDMPANKYAKKATEYLKKAKNKGHKKVFCVVLESHNYSCGKEYGFTYYGSKSQVNKFFKELEQEKKTDPSLAFAKGMCRLSDGVDGMELEFALKGTIKPAKIKQNNKKLFSLMGGVKLKDVFKGEFKEGKEVVVSSASEEVEISEDKAVVKDDLKEVEINEDKLEGVGGKLLGIAAREYIKARKEMMAKVYPFYTKEKAIIYTQTHVDIAKNAYAKLVNFLKVCEQREGKNPTILDNKPGIKSLKDAILEKSLKPKYGKIWKDVETDYNNRIETLSEAEEAKVAEIEMLLKEIEVLEAAEKN